MYFVFIEIAGVHYLEVELAVALNCRHQIHNHLVHINFPLSAIIHLTMTSVYKKYQCNQLTIDELHRLRQIVLMLHHRVSSTLMSIQPNTKRHCQSSHHQRQLICERSPAVAEVARERVMSKRNIHN